MTVLLDCRAPMVVRSHTPLGMKEQVVDSLRGLEGPARHQRIQALATALGVGKSTVYRWQTQEAQRGLAKGKRGSNPTEEQRRRILVLWVSTAGDATMAYPLAVAEGVWEGSLRGFQRFIQMSFSDAEKGAVLDEEDARAILAHLRAVYPWSDWAWQIDIVDSCVDVLDGQGGVASGMAVAIVDARSGVTRGWCATLGTPTAAAVLQALVQAIRGRTEVLISAEGTVREITLRGAPLILRPDNGSQLIAEVVLLLAMFAGTSVIPAWPKCPTGKAFIEQFNRDEKRWAKPLPGSRRGPQRLNGAQPFHRPVLSAEDYARRFEQWVHERDRQVARGETKCRLELYADNLNPDEPERLVSDEVLARFALQRTRQERFIIRQGRVEYRTKLWTHEALQDLRTSSVELWYSTVDETYVEARVGDQAYQLTPVMEVPAATQGRIRRRRQELHEDQNRVRREAAAAALERTEEEKEAAAAAREMAAGTAPAPAAREVPDVGEISADELDAVEAHENGTSAAPDSKDGAQRVADLNAAWKDADDDR